MTAPRKLQALLGYTPAHAQLTTVRMLADGKSPAEIGAALRVRNNSLVRQRVWSTCARFKFGETESDCEAQGWQAMQDKARVLVTDCDAYADELGRRVDACRKVWRWLPGAVDIRGRRIVHGEDRCGSGRVQVLAHGMQVADLDVPDMTDPGTQGTALTLIAEHNHRRSIFDALGDAYHAVSCGRSYPEALTVLIERCEAAVAGEVTP